MPKGSLIIMDGKSGPRYLRMISSKESNTGERIRRSITQDEHMIYQLARKKYLKESIKLLELEINRIKLFLDKSNPPEPQKIIHQFTGSYSKLPEEYFLPEVRRTKTWANEPYEQNSFNLQGKKHMTTKGIKVRSKSELLIADRLESYDIPYRYEQMIYFENYAFSPDFTILTSRGLFYWEHCGLMTDAIYRRNNNWKLTMYDKMDIVPWRNLIITYDTDDGGINLGIIEAEIKNKLLPIRI